MVESIKVFERIKATSLRVGMRLVYADDLSAPVVAIGLPFSADGTIRVMLDRFKHPFALSERFPVSIVVEKNQEAAAVASAGATE